MKPSDKKQDYPDILHHSAINGTTGFCHELSRYLKLIAFSGDLGAPHAPLLPAPKPPHGGDRNYLRRLPARRSP